MSLPNPINVTYVSPSVGDTFPFQYIVKDTDNIINIDTTNGAVDVILRNIRNSGMLQYQPLLSINDGGNNASVNNITIYPSGGDVINDSASFVLNTDGANSIIQISDINQWVVSSSQPSGAPPIPFEGTNYIYVYANGTDTENATELQNAYNLAKASTPNNAPLSANNQITIIAGVGYYNFGSTTFVMDTPYINLVSLDGNRSIIFNSVNANGTISITGGNLGRIFVKGVDVSIGGKPFLVETLQNDLIVENCKGGNKSFCNTFILNAVTVGTYIDCEGGDNSFGSGLNNTYGIIVSGTFINCKAGELSFGGGGIVTASGTFLNCEASNFSFGSSSDGFGEATGIFKNCISMNYSFGYPQSSGTFENCVGGFLSWSGTITGSLYFCRLTFAQSSPSPSLGGKIIAFISQNTFIAQNP
jgi:hypothetical protein